jgi:uncharacterized protein YndB with AHSA1/START domain
LNLHEYYQPTPDAPSLRLDRLLPKRSPSEVWNLLFEPANAARIWFGSSMEADLRAGGVVRWFGSWEGVHFEDRAQVLESETNALFDAIYFSSFSGQAEGPTTRQRLTIRLAPEGDGTRVLLEHANFRDLTSRDHSISAWNAILDVVEQEA